MRGGGAKTVIVVDQAFLDCLNDLPKTYDGDAFGDDLTGLQYTSGATWPLPAAVHHSHRSIVTLMVAALHGTGIRPGDWFFCASSPAWGHGRWHRTLAPLALGVSTGTFSGRFDAARLLRALHDFGITTMSAAATHCGMMRNSGQVDAFAYALDKLSFTRELIDSKTAAYIEAHFGAKAGSMHVAAEIGVTIANYPGANYPGADDLEVRDRALGKALPGAVVEVQDANGAPRRARTGR